MVEWSKTESGTCGKIEDVPKGAIIESVDGKVVLGICEICERPIYEDDQYGSSDEGWEAHENCLLSN